MAKTKNPDTVGQNEEIKTENTTGIEDKQEETQIQIKEILDSECPIPTYLKSDHGLVLKQIFAQLGSIDKINDYINMRCSIAFPERKKPEHGFDMVIDHEFFMGKMEKEEIKKRLVWFIKDILGPDDKHIFLLGPVDINFLAETVSKFKVSDKSEEEIKTILSSKITHMQREIRESTLLKIDAYKSINIYTGPNDNLKGIIANKLLEMDCTKLEDANFVATELTENGHKMGQFAGIEKAFELYTKNPEKKLILMSAMPFEEFKKHQKDNTKLDFLLTQKNVRFLYLFDTTAFNEFQKETGFAFDKKDLPKDLKPRPIKTFDPKLLENLFEPDYLSTITFNMGITKPEEMVDIMKESLKKIDLKNIQNCTFIDVCAIYKEGQWLQNMEGLNIAMEELQKNPERKIILTVPLADMASLKTLAKKAGKEDILEFLLGRSNVRFFEYGEDPKILENIFESKKENTETKETILGTMQFYESRGRKPYLKDFFSTLDLVGLHLKDSIVVDLRPDDGKTWDDITGLENAYETLQKYPDSKIILCSLIPIEVFQKVIEGKKSADELKALLQGKNVRMIQSSGGNSMTPEEVLRQFDGMYQKNEISETNDGGNTFKQLSEISSEVAFQKIMESEISHFLHDAKYWIDKEQQKNMIYEEQLDYFFFHYQGEKSDKRLAFEDRLIAILQMQHPSFKLLPRENNLQWIIDMYKYARTQTLPEGTRFEGVFVDWDGCFYDNKNKKFNQKIIDMIKEWEAKGYVVTLRTGGNLEMKQKLLDEAGLQYKIQNKTEYKGGIVEIAIDNDSQEFLFANAKIKSETHIKV